MYYSVQLYLLSYTATFDAYNLMTVRYYGLRYCYFVNNSIEVFFETRLEGVAVSGK